MRARLVWSWGLVWLACSACGGNDAAPPAESGMAATAAGATTPAAGATAAGSGGAAGVNTPPPVRTLPGPQAPCTGKPGLVRGKSTQTIAGRSFVYYAPSTLDANVPAPVVLIPHGFTMNAEQMFEITRYSALADQERFIAVFLNGQPGQLGPWNVGAPDCGSTLGGLLPTATGDDQAYLDGVLAFAEADQCVDRAHVFMTGFSMGGYFSNETGCTRPDIRAVAPHSGGTHDLGACASQHKPVLIMHFQEDALIPFMCGQKARDRWVAKNGCQLDAPDVKMVAGGTCEYYKGCPADGQVAFCSFSVPATEPMMSYKGHGWSGGSREGSAGGGQFAVGSTESATQLSWSFFKTYAWMW